MKKNTEKDTSVIRMKLLHIRNNRICNKKNNTEYIGVMKLIIDIGSLANTILMGWVRQRSSQSRFSSRERVCVLCRNARMRTSKHCF